MKKEELQELLYQTYDFYKPTTKEVAIEKRGIGHEAEHVKGVLMRMDEAVDIFNANKTERMKQNEAFSIDKAVSSTVATFHDIGNCIDRDNHNHLARGIIQGKLSYSDILSVPIKDLSNDQQALLKEVIEDKETIAFLLGNPEYSKTIKERLLLPKALFDIGYDGKDKQDILNEIKKDYGMDDEDLEIIKESVSKIDGKYSEKLQSLSKEIKNIFNDREITLIAEAVQDHNIDYNNDGTRYRARNIYGSLIADADKDNVAMTFALRTFAYAINKWTQNKNQEIARQFVSDSGANYRKCISHIMHQAWERYRVGSQEAPPAGIHTYKTLDKINGVQAVLKNASVNKYIEEGLTEQEAAEKVAKEEGYKVYRVPFSPIRDPDIKYLDEGKLFFVLSDSGADNHSQIDTILSEQHKETITPYKDAKEAFSKRIKEWAIGEKEDENIEKLYVIIKEMWDKDRSTIEAIVNIPETIRWVEGLKDIDVEDVWNEIMEFSEQLPGIINGEYNEKFSYESVVERVTEDIDDFER